MSTASPGLVLARPRPGDPARGLRLRRLPGNALVHHALDLVVVELLLPLLGPVGGADQGREPCLRHVAKHVLQVGIRPRIHRLVVLHRHQLPRDKVFGQGRPGVDQEQETVRLAGGGVGRGPLVCGRRGLSLRAAVPGAAPRIPLGEKGEQGDRRKGRAQEQEERRPAVHGLRAPGSPRRPALRDGARGFLIWKAILHGENAPFAKVLPPAEVLPPAKVLLPV